MGRRTIVGMVALWVAFAGIARGDLIGYWNFDEGAGTLAADASSNAAQGTIQGGATHVGGKFGGALSFDPSSSAQVRVFNAAAKFAAVSDQATISLWQYGGPDQRRSDTIFSGKNSGGGRVLQAHLPWGDGNVYWDAGNSYDRISKGASASEYKDQWNHWAFTKDATSGMMKVYLNGALWHATTPTTHAAVGDPATQSSSPYWQGGPEKAVDGNTNGYWQHSNPSANSVTHTSNEPQAWWRVDLGADTAINDLVLYNRADCCWQRLSDFHVSILDGSMAEVWRQDFFTTAPNPNSNPIQVNPGGQTGRYIQVQLNGTEVLSLAEVVVNGQGGHTLPMGGIQNFAIGSAIDAEYYQGVIDDFAVWNEVLSPAQIAQLATRAVTISAPTIRSTVTNRGGSLSPGGDGAIGTTEFVSGNIALGGTASQSSTINGGVPSRAIDGNTNGVWGGNSITHTNNELEPWWRVDLGSQATIDQLSLWNRTDSCCIGRLTNLHVSILDDTLTEVWGQDYYLGGGYPNPNLDINVGGVTGQFVQVQLYDTGTARVLSLAEVQVDGGYDYIQDDDGVLTIEVDPLTGTTDKLIVGGTLYLGGTLDVQALSELQDGQRFDILDWGYLDGTFDEILLPTSKSWDISSLYVDGTIMVLPEPATMTLLGLGGLALLRRRRQR